MATTYLQTLLHHHHLSSSSSDTISSAPTTTTTTLFLKPTSIFQKLSTAHSTQFAIYSTNATNATNATTPSPPATTITTTATATTTFDVLQQHLSSQDFRQADEETRRLIIVLAGEPAQKRGYVFFSEAQFISESDLQCIDNLWRKYSDNKFGYSVQKKIYEKQKEDFSLFFRKVGWMKKLDTEIEQYNYRAFPNEFTWELKDDTPEGHLPLTNALRGTQLLKSILYHPAFQSVEQEEVAGEEQEGEVEQQSKKSSKSLNKGLFKTDYSF